MVKSTSLSAAPTFETPREIQPTCCTYPVLMVILLPVGWQSEAGDA